MKHCTALLPVLSFPFEDIYANRQQILLTLPKRQQKILFYFALLTASLGVGGVKAIECPLSAYSLEDCGPRELLSLFNWFHWLVNVNSAVVFVSISYIQQSMARNLGFLIPFVSGLMAMITWGEMIYKPKTASSLLTPFGVVVRALLPQCHRGHLAAPGQGAPRGPQTHPGTKEGTKALTRLFPFLALQILYRTCIVQNPSGYYLQTMNSNLHFGGFVLPVAAMNVISIVPLLILVPILECINSWLFSSKDTAHSPTIYIALGHLLATAGFSGMRRERFPQLQQTLSKQLLLVSSMPCFHLAPQYVLLGVAEALVTPSCTWFPHLLHEGKLERFFFFLASLMLVNTLGFWTTAHRYNNLHEDCTNDFRGNLPGEKLLEHEEGIKHYNAVLESSPILSPVEKT